MGIEMPPKAAAAKEPLKKCKWNVTMEDALLDFLIRNSGRQARRQQL
jgi:hypothetical protein